VALVRERTIPIERPLLVSEVSANLQILLKVNFFVMLNLEVALMKSELPAEVCLGGCSSSAIHI
jgi:hypothetical protein